MQEGAEVGEDGGLWEEGGEERNCRLANSCQETGVPGTELAVVLREPFARNLFSQAVDASLYHFQQAF